MQICSHITLRNSYGIYMLHTSRQFAHILLVTLFRKP